ncbi:MAG: 4-hydroxy-3-methylbut-2-enyl diphosphate reductase, partial [Actinobacteria bacterium]|nr:4-hydroxy-3-methylbut-2-enyl diphosphate reductase [Actinomycetota bacterium]
MVRKVILAEPRGFCAGVEMAIKALAWMVELFDPPVYCYHDIVHNVAVVDVFERAGVVFVDDVDDVPGGAPLMLSAHGTAPGVVDRAHERAGVVIDAACPLVAKVHHEVKRRVSKGYDIIYVGHHGHDEAVGTMAVAPEAVHLVGSASDVADVPDTGRPVALLSQTTLGVGEWADARAAVRERFPDVWTPARSDLCFATTNRQTALKALAEKVDAII